MARRQSKKLLVGLGSTLGAAAITTMGGFGMNGLLRINNQSTTAVDQLNTIQAQNIQNFPNLHVATAPMFINTTNLKSFHYGNVRKGQTITPYGWLGVYEDKPNPQGFTRYRLALTAWNGEILWVYDGIEANTDGTSRRINGNIYDVKYDFNTDLITIVYTAAPTGLFNPRDMWGYSYLEIIDAKTGQQLPGWKPLDIGTYWGQKAMLAFDDERLLVNVLNDPNQAAGWRALDLYKLDVISRPGNSNVMMIHYTPTYNQLYRYDQTTLPTLKTVLRTYGKAGYVNIVEKDRTNWWESSGLDLQSWFNSLWLSNDQLSFKDDFLQKAIVFDINQAYLLTDPYITYAESEFEWFIHLFVGDQAGNAYHFALNFTYGGKADAPRLNQSKSKAEKISEGLTQNFSLNTKYKWYENAKYFNRAMVSSNPANLRVNKNMFNSNLATWAYPYATVSATEQGGTNQVDDTLVNGRGRGTAWTAYNVAQILINPATGLIDRGSGAHQSRNYDLAKQILTKWESDRNAKVQPWPSPSRQSIQHNFNRLVAVSPFDNSFVYSALAFFTQNHYTDANEKFKSWWLFNANTTNPLNATPVVIAGDKQQFGSGLNAKVLNMADLEINGPTWDLESAINSNTKIYLNHSGTDANTPQGKTGWQTSKILPLGPISTTTALTGFLGTFGQTSSKTFVIDSNTPAGLIHSRANLKMWYPLTQASIENPTNMLSKTDLVNNGVNGGQIEADFTKAITIPSGKNAKDLVDLVTHVGNTAALPIANPEIYISDDGGSATVNMIAKFSPQSATLNWYKSRFGQYVGDIQRLVNIQKYDRIEHTSVEVFSKIGTDVKFTSLQERFGVQTNPTQSNSFETITTPTWFDVRQKPGVNTPFGSINNNQLDNNFQPLRVLLQLVKPANSPTWIERFDPMVWQPAPIDANRLANESSFSDVLKQYLKNLLMNITNTDLTQWGIGNLRVRATLGINPQFSQNQQIYHLNNKQVVLGKNGSTYIFEDRHDVEQSLIYDQSATTYATMNQQGYGAAVASKIGNNWKTIPKQGKFLVDLPLNKLRDLPGLAYPIVRRGVSFADSTPLFKVKLRPNQLILAPVNPNDPGEVNWLRNLLSTMNFKYGMSIILEGWANGRWNNIKSAAPDESYSDQEIQAAWDMSNKVFRFNTNQNDITKLRIRLTNRLSQSANDFIMWEPQPISATDPKLLSWEHPVSTIDVVIDKTWFDKVTLTSSGFLDAMTEQDLVSYQNQIKYQFEQINPTANLWSKLNWEWIFDGQTYTTNAALVGAMRTKINAVTDPIWNYGFWTLWSGQAGDNQGKKITARLVIREPNQSNIQLVDPQGDLIIDNAKRQGDVKSTIKTKMELKPYLGALQAKGLDATPGITQGTLQNVSVPTLPTVAAPWNSAFGTIVTMLSNFGVSFEFQTQNSNGTWTNNWVRNLNDINQYWPPNPRIKIRAVVINRALNNLLYYDNQAIDVQQGFGQDGIEIAINIPKLVVNPDDFSDFLAKEVAQTNPFTGNTWRLNIDNVQNFESAITAKLITSSDPNGNNTHTNLNQYLQYQYQLDNGQFMSANALKTHLASLDVDQNSNAIRMKIILVQSPGKPEFTLDSALNQSFVILQDDNHQVKKWIHGTQQEAALSLITVSGDRANLKYSFPAALQNYQNNAVNHVSLQWSWADSTTNQAPNHSSPTWVDNQTSGFPTDLTNKPNATKIYVRLKHDDQNDEVYQYGPQVSENTAPGSWHIGEIDLSKITFLLKVDNNWFTEELVTPTLLDLNSLDESAINKWKDKIWAKTTLANELKSQVDIKFQVFDNSWIDAAALVTKIKQAQHSYQDPTHHGIISLWNPSVSAANQSSMIKIKAKFTKTTSMIEFVNLANKPINNEQELTGTVNTANIETTIDLSQYFNILQSKPTTIITNGQIGTIKMMILPSNPAGTYLLAGKSFDQIMSILAGHQLHFEFSADVNASSKTWTSYQNTTMYNPTIAKLNIALINDSSNLKVQWNGANGGTIATGNDNKASGVEIKLNAPKAINITTGDYNNLIAAFTGDTKNLQLNLQILLAKINEIKQNHFNASQNSEFSNAPLGIKVQVGNEQFVDYKQLTAFLKSKPSDVGNRAIKIAFYIETTGATGQQEWVLQGLTSKEIATDSNSPLKIYINDQGIEQELKATILSGTSKAFTWTWPAGYTVDAQTGALTHPNKGKGLKLEFSFNPTLSPVNGSTGHDPLQHWVSQMPNSYDPNQVLNKQIFIRFGVLDSNRYIAEKAPINNGDKITLSLNLQEILDVNANWLQAQFASQKKWITDVTLADFNAYEDKVKANMTNWSAANKAKVAIQYTFNGKLYSAAALVSAIVAARDSTAHLQLWNGVAGSQIEATFVAAQPNGNYVLNWVVPNQTKKVVDTSNINTQIDLEAVITWLKRSKISFTPGSSQHTIDQITIGSVDTSSSKFDGQSWEQVAVILKQLNVKIEYQEMVNNQPAPSATGWVDDLKLIKRFDKRGQFLIRFVLESNRADNISTILFNDQLQGTTAAQLVNKPVKLQSDAIVLNLQTPLTIEIAPQIISEFINYQQVINGNTRDLTISEAAEVGLIKAILAQNHNANPNANPQYINAPLKVEYAIGQTPNSGDWYQRTQFIKNLKSFPTDQNSNKIQFRFVVADQDPTAPDFSVANTSYTLNEHTNINQPNGSTRVKYFIHTANWETNADNVTVTGSNNKMIWDFVTAFGANNVDDQNKVSLKTAGANPLVIQFTTNANAQYNDATGTSLETGWVYDKPNQIAANTQHLKIRIVPVNDSVFYEAKETSRALVHAIDLSNLKREIKVDKGWLNQELIVANSSKELADLQISDLAAYEDSVFRQFADQSLKPQLVIKYNISNFNNLTKEQLLAKITTELTQPGTANLGIVHLWNEIAGLKIRANFDLSSTNSSYVLVDKSTDQIISPQDTIQTIKTKSIITSINFTRYIEQLKKLKINVTLGTTSDSLKSIDWPAHSGSTTEQFGSKTLEQILTVFETMGITMQVRPVMAGQTPGSEEHWVAWNNLTTYDARTSKIEIRFLLELSKGVNIRVHLENNNPPQLDGSVNRLKSNPIELQLNAPLKFVIEQQWIDSFKTKAPFSGNTKYLKIAEATETELIEQIFRFNQNNNADFAQVRDQFQVLYTLGDGRTNANWQTREQIIKSLSQTSSDQITNQFSMKFALDNKIGLNQQFQVDEHLTTIVDAAIGLANAKVKIYIHENDREIFADQISVSGTNNNIQWIYPSQLKPDTDGTFSNIPGLQMQWSTKVGITNESFGNTNSDPNQGWVNQPPKTISASNRFVAIQLVARDGYEYGPQFKTTSQNPDDPSRPWTVHNVDVTNLKSEIIVDLDALKTIIWTGATDALNEVDIKKLENKAIQNATKDVLLQSKLKVQYQITWGAYVLVDWADSTQAMDALRAWVMNTSGPTSGLIKFNGWGSTHLAGVKARFISDDPDFIVISSNGQDPNRGLEIEASLVQTKVDLAHYTQILKTRFVTLQPNSSQSNLAITSLPPMDANAPTGFLTNYTWDQISKVLALVGLNAEFRAPGTTNSQWTTLDKITALNQNNQLQMRWVVNSRVIDNSSSANVTAFAQTFNLITDGPQDLTKPDHASNSIELKVNLPIKIITDSSQLRTQLADQFSGNTYILNTGQATNLVDQIIRTTIATNNTPGNPQLKIQFSLDHFDLENNQVWFDINELVTVLQRSKTNWPSNQILAKFVINNPDASSQQYEISDGQEVVVVAKNDTAAAPVKKWIHEGLFWNDIISSLKPVGTTQSYSFPNYDVWSASVPIGLVLELNHVSNQEQNGNWIPFDLNKLPKPLNPDKQLWVRFKVLDSFAFASAHTANGRYTEAKLLDATNLKAIINVEKKWLDLIRPSGTLKSLTIDDSQFIQAIKDANILPSGLTNLVYAQYRVSGSDWLDSSDFQKYLQSLDGAKDANRWILTHNDLEVRFAINQNIPQADQYLLAIDGSITEIDHINNRALLITDPSQVKGIINADKLTDFTKENFHISGTSTKPKLDVTNEITINQLVSQYASENLFDIQFSTQFDKNTSQWIWDPNHSLINENRTGLIDEDGLIKLNVQIGLARRFAIRLISQNQNYQVEQAGKIQPDGYIIDLTDNVKITYEIINPFANQGKTLAITSRGTQSEAIWNQGQGQFRIVVGDSQFQPESTLTTAQTFLFNNLPSDEANQLEFVYRIFDHQPTDGEIAYAQTKSSINDYSTTGVNGWNSFSFAAGVNGEYWSENLKLKVGNYVMVALRVKAEAAFGEKAYRLKDDQFSVLIPVLANGDTPGRIAGFKIDPSKTPVLPDSVNLASQMANFSGLLDGWTKFNHLALENDADDNVAGIDLELNFYNDFHLDSADKVLVSASNSKLVKRVAQNMQQGLAYVDQTGTPIQDKDGQIVYLLTDPTTGRLAPPQEADQPTRKIELVSQPGGWYQLYNDGHSDANLMSLFRNQKLTITYKAKVGLGTQQLPDYELTWDLTTDLTTIISPQIKFAIENPQNIVYDWQNRDNFGDDKVEFESANGEVKPIEGASRVKTIAQLQRRRRTDASDVTTITGDNGFEAAQSMEAVLQKDFGGQLQFNYTHIKKQGGQSTVTNSANFYDLTNLHNGDRIIVELKATADDQIYTDAPEPLAILVSGLAVDAPDASLLQWLRVEQGGTTNGTGSFRVLVHNPNGAYQDPKDYLRGWKFLVRVWDGAKQEVKIDWTDEQAMLTGLSNGDRVEWKLVDQDNNPVQDAYYNTVALRHEVTNPDGTVKFNFGQVDYSDGPNSQRVIQAGIGDYPPKDQADHFPSTSGFTIAGLQEQNHRFDLQPWAFAKIIETLGPFYRGQNGNGALNFNHQYFEGLWYVNLAGELYQTPRYPEPDLQTPQEIPLSQFLNHTTFFTQDPTLNPAQVGFKFMTNATNTGNYLSNGDQVWARFNSVVGLPDASLEPTHHLQSRSGDPEIAYVYQLPDVSGLDQISDPMHPLWWLLIVLAGLVTVGGAWIVVWRKRHHKLRVKNPSA